MSKFRSILALAMAFVMTLFITFASPAEAKTKAKARSYTAEQIETIQAYSGDLGMMIDRFAELGDLINKEDWVFARNFIHGPLGELRFKMLGIARELYPESAKEARELTRAVFNQLNLIDQAGANKDSRAARKAFSELNKAAQEFVKLIPQG